MGEGRAVFMCLSVRFDLRVASVLCFKAAMASCQAAGKSKLEEEHEEHLHLNDSIHTIDPYQQ